MKKFISNFFTAVLMFFTLWIIVSLADIVNHNHPFEINYKAYSDWNAFIIMYNAIK